MANVQVATVETQLTQVAVIQVAVVLDDKRLGGSCPDAGGIVACPKFLRDQIFFL